jgi:hypothetical protein
MARLVMGGGIGDDLNSSRTDLRHSPASNSEPTTKNSRLYPLLL